MSFFVVVENKVLFFLPTAELLRENNNDRVPKEDRYLLQATNRRRRRDHIRLQVPSRRRKDTVSLRSSTVPRVPQLRPRFTPLDEGVNAATTESFRLEAV